MQQVQHPSWKDKLADITRKNDTMMNPPSDLITLSIKDRRKSKIMSKQGSAFGCSPDKSIDFKSRANSVSEMDTSLYGATKFSGQTVEQQKSAGL